MYATWNHPSSLQPATKKLTEITEKLPQSKAEHMYSRSECKEQSAKLAFTSTDVISTSPQNFLTSRIDFTVLLLFEFLEKHHLPVGQVKNRID